MWMQGLNLMKILNVMSLTHYSFTSVVSISTDFIFFFWFLVFIREGGTGEPRALQCCIHVEDGELVSDVWWSLDVWMMCSQFAFLLQILIFVSVGLFSDDGLSLQHDRFPQITNQMRPLVNHPWVKPGTQEQVDGWGLELVALREGPLDLLLWEWHPGYWSCGPIRWGNWRAAFCHTHFLFVSLFSPTVFSTCVYNCLASLKAYLLF